MANQASINAAELKLLGCLERAMGNDIETTFKEMNAYMAVTSISVSDKASSMFAGSQSGSFPGSAKALIAKLQDGKAHQVYRALQAFKRIEFQTRCGDAEFFIQQDNGDFAGPCGKDHLNHVIGHKRILLDFLKIAGYSMTIEDTPVGTRCTISR